jgi:hypothetical protein
MSGTGEPSRDRMCAACAHFERHVRMDAEIGQEVNLKTGDCRFDPPRPRLGANQRAARGLWPVVGLTDWCGKFLGRGV